MLARRTGLRLAFFVAAALVFSSVAFAATFQLSPEKANRVRALIELAYGGNTTQGEPAHLRVPANVTTNLICGTFQGGWKCVGESLEVCPPSIPVLDNDTGQTLDCTLDCDPPVNGECDCDMVSCS